MWKAIGGLTMPKVLTDGKMKIGAYMFPDRKKPALCIEEGNTIKVYGYFQGSEQASEFMTRLGKMVHAEFEEDQP